MKLHDFLTANSEELIKRCRAKVARRASPRPTEPELNHGIPIFLDQLIRTLRTNNLAERHVISGSAERGRPASEIGGTAASHGDELLKKGFTVDQVVHDYGDLCQAVTELAVEQNAPITADEFRTLNQCLDNAIAGAVTEYGRQHDIILSAQETAAANARLGFLAHELRNRLTSAMLAVAAIKSGNVGLSGATGAVLDRSLTGLRDLIDRSLAEVRLTGGLPPRREPISISEFLNEVQVSAGLEAKAKGLSFTVAPVDKGLAVDADRQMLYSAVANLLQNAFKFTRPSSLVSLSAHGVADRVVIEIEDQCGGLPLGKAEELFRPFEQHGGDRSGLGLGLSITRRGVEANSGTVQVRNLPGAGCIFTIDLPRLKPMTAG
ncbi:MAG TPA: HAMP domain-containing sensor histidine kinase [Polyangia bacterium]|nr:HAMP domain-containing sensor histidine kinase [Polyangia bacterium]